MKNAATGVTDTEADVFSYSFGGRRGKFILPYNSDPFLVPYAALDIIPSPGLQKFEVTDESGILYRFGQNAQGVACKEGTTATNGGNPTFSATTAWHLADIVAPNSNDQITFQYQSAGSYLHQDVSYSYVISDQCYAAPQGTCPTNSFSPQVHSNDSWGGQLGQSIITFETGKVKFILSDGFRSDETGLKFLDRIEITDLDDNILKTIKFNYSYFTDANGSIASLKLDAVEFKDNAGTVVQKYQFEYFTNSFSWNPTLANFRNARDLWGYYNGALANTDLILAKTIPYQATASSTPSTVTIGGALNRGVNTQFIKEGVLKKITFPTGGYTEFDYESNKYLDDNGVPTLAGGLRVKQIKSSEGPSSQPIIKTYAYGSDGSGNGKPNFTSYQFNYHNTQMYYSDCQDQVAPIVNYQIRTFHSNTAFNQDPFDSSPVRYTFVTEYFGDPAANTNGKITYEFDNGLSPGDVDHLVASSGKYYRNSLAWKRGKLTAKTVYDNADNKLSESMISYGEFKEENKLIGVGVYSFIAGNITCGGNTCLNEVNEWVHAQTHFFTSYYQHTGVLLETQVLEKKYQNGDINKFVTTQTDNVFEANYLQLNESTVTAADGTQTTLNRYPFQLTANSSSTGNARGVYMLQNKHILSTPVETYTYVSKGSTENLISAQVTTYRQHEGNPDYVLPDQVYLWEPATAVVAKSTYAEMAIDGTNDGVSMDEDLKPRIKMISYNSGGDILSARKVDDAPISYQYGYDNSLPVAEVTNAVDSRYATSTQGFASTPITVGGSSPVTSSSINFTVDYQGTVRLKLGVSGSPSFTTYVDYSGSLGNGSMTLGTGSCANTEVVFNNVSAGAKTIYITVRTGTPGTFVGACGQVEYPDIITTQFGFSEFVYENFEEGAVTSPLVAHTGKGYLNGDYTPTFVPPNSRTYIIEYWHWDGAKWIYTTKPYTGTSTAVSEGSAIDNVRIYPTDAFMKSYTHDPLLGITSAIDENGIVSYYDYDDFGRLLRIRNDKGYVEKQYSYHYKGN